MVKYKILIGLMVLVGFASCSVRFASMQMAQAEYLGNEIRIDGYYFRSTSEVRDQNNIDMYFVLYSNGIFIASETFVPPIDVNKVNEKILDRKNLPLKHKGGTGLFKVRNDSIIVIEYWTHAAEWPIPTSTKFGKILNDSTIKIFLFNRDATWHFQPYLTKPDSTYAAGVDDKQN